MGGLAKFRDNSVKFENDTEVKKMTFKNIVTGEFSKWMKQKDLKQIDIANRMKVSKSAISSLLSGDRNLTLDKIVELADAINCKPYFGLVDKNDSYPSPYTTITAFHVEYKEKTTFTSNSFSFKHEAYSSVKFVTLENN